MNPQKDESRRARRPARGPQFGAAAVDVEKQNKKQLVFGPCLVEVSGHGPAALVETQHAPRTS